MKRRPLRRFSQLLLLALCFLVFAEIGVSKERPSKQPSSTADQGNSARWEADNNEDIRSPGYFQVVVMDFADEYNAAIGAAIDDYIAVEPDASKRVAAQYWKMHYTTAAMSIAASRDPRTNLLDMAVFVAAGKWAVNSYWVPKIFGHKAEALSSAYEQLNRRISVIVGEVLTPSQLSDLGQLLSNWEKSNPAMHEVYNVRLRNLDGVHLSTFDDGQRAWGLLAYVRRFLSRVDKSLLYGERLMFCLERAPRTLSLQGDLTIAEVGQAFPLTTLRPELLATSLQQGINHNEEVLSGILPQLGTTLESANALTKNLNQTVQTLQTNGLMSNPAAVASDVNKALGHLDASVAGLNLILEKNPTGTWKPEEVLLQIKSETDRMMDEVFRRMLILIGVFFAGVAVILLLAKMLFSRGDK